MSDVSVFISYHKNYHLFKNSILKPIHVGSALANHKLGMQLDCDGENISVKNPNFCELTAQYWAWKNCNSDYIGFMHYRRLFNFTDNVYPEDRWGCVVEHDITNIFEKYGLTDNNLNKVITEYDVIVAKQWSVTHTNSVDMFDHYKSSDPILLEKYPQYQKAVEVYHKSSTGFFNNMFVLRKDLFDEYSSMLFDVLFTLETELDISSYDIQEARVFGYISEWLFGIFVTHIKSTRELNVKELQRVFIDSKQVIPAENAIHVFFAADDKFSQHLGVALTSILGSSSPNDKYYFHIMDGGISNKHKRILSKLVNENIEFIRINDKLFDKLSITETMKHTTRHTYYRYLIPDLKPELDKVIYLDCDLVVKQSLSELWNTELGNNYAAACEDTWAYPVFEWKLELGLRKESFYFNAGVLLLNLAEMRKDRLKDKLFTCSIRINNSMKYQDQDVLNLVLEDKVKLLPVKWNLQQTAFFDTGSTMYSNEEIETARMNPAIIHFSGAVKPWQPGCLNPLWQEYFNFLSISPWSNKFYKKQILKVMRVYHISKYKVKTKIKKIVRKD
jgi:lipopolysaccharide biosynthesis glycosyltransferase